MTGLDEGGRATTTHSITAPARPAVLTGVHELLDKVWRSHPALTVTDRARFESAVIEIVGNVVVHAPTRPERRRVMLTLLVSCDATRLVADLRDDGEPAPPDLDTTRVPDAEASSGLALVRAVSDQLVYERMAASNRWLVTCRRTA